MLGYWPFFETEGQVTLDWSNKNNHATIGSNTGIDVNDVNRSNLVAGIGIFPVLATNLDRGNTFYEFSNHLGNVLVTFSDRKFFDDTDDSYFAEVKTATDYYPFGMAMPGRDFSSGDYRFGFNGKEKDVDGEWGENTTNYDYGFRIYNPSIGKFLSVDPLSASYPKLTPYQFASNSPISGIDVDGLEHAGIDVWNEVYYQSDSYLEKSDEERVADEQAKAKLGLIAIAGAAFIYTGGIVYEAGSALYLKAALWFSNPLNQVLVAEAGAFGAAAIGPDPSAQYSSGASDELGNAVGATVRWFFRGTSSKVFKGSSASMRVDVTPTSNNPIVSTLYGIFNKTKYGKGTLLIGNADDLLKIEKLPGQLKHDKEIGLDMLPSEFSTIAKELSLDNATSILKEMGFSLPSKINSLEQLNSTLKEVPEMTVQQIEMFMEKANKTMK